MAAPPSARVQGSGGGGRDEGTRRLTALPSLSADPGVPPPAAHGVPDGGAAGDAPDPAPDVPGLRREGADAARGSAGQGAPLPGRAGARCPAVGAFLTVPGEGSRCWGLFWHGASSDLRTKKRSVGFVLLARQRAEV